MEITEKIKAMERENQEMKEQLIINDFMENLSSEKRFRYETILALKTLAAQIKESFDSLRTEIKDYSRLMAHIHKVDVEEGAKDQEEPDLSGKNVEDAD